MLFLISKEFKLVFLRMTRGCNLTQLAKCFVNSGPDLHHEPQIHRYASTGAVNEKKTNLALIKLINNGMSFE